jgi:spermidine synthase
MAEIAENMHRIVGVFTMSSATPTAKSGAATAARPPGLWTELGRATTPEGDQLLLRQCDEEFEIRFNGWELMSSRTYLSEEALARLVCEDLEREPRRVLIGGLGMGYTLRATLEAIGPDARVTVCELVPAVVDWVRGPLASLARRPLDDNRVEISIGSVIDTISTSQGRYDAVILDTDNGPESVLHEPNGFLYSRKGLEMTKSALARDGRIGFWSADRSMGFEADLEAAGMKWRRVDVDARGGDTGPEHSIYLARPL